jgi:hypothetical protein
MPSQAAEHIATLASILPFCMMSGTGAKVKNHLLNAWPIGN